MQDTVMMDRPIVVALDDGKPEYRASSAGYCRRMLTAARLGYEPLPPRDFMTRAAREGKRHEDWVIEDLIEMGYPIDMGTRNMLCKINFPAFSITGHIDAADLKDRIYEIKSMSRARFETWRRKRFDAFPEYAAQVTAYKHMISDETGKTWNVVYAVKCRDNGQLDVIEIDWTPISFEDVYDRLLSVELAARKKLLPNTECEPGSFERYICRWRYLCEEPVKEKTPEEIPDLSDLANDWRRGKAMQEEAEALVDAAKERFKEVMASHGLKKLNAWGLSLNYYTGSRENFTRKGLTEAMAWAGIDKSIIKDVLDRAANPSTYTAVRITDLEGAV
jgi:hypothetical protein